MNKQELIDLLRIQLTDWEANDLTLKGLLEFLITLSDVEFHVHGEVISF